jgi:hypothetical protein
MNVNAETAEDADSARSFGLFPLDVFEFSLICGERFAEFGRGRFPFVFEF